ncbi:MAG: LptF/LptG family permease, partial [Planctomycetota bacterium]|nr:LptF/LptG family permease [Planctomycetota bacterium]
VVPRPNSNDVFVVTDVTPDRLRNRGKGSSLMSTADLVSRIRNPAMGVVSVRTQTLNVHTRLTRPLSALLMVFVVVPLIIRRESRSLIGNMAICCCSLAGIHGLAQVCQNLGGSLVSPDLAVWTPVIFSGGLGAWLTGSVQS